MIAQARKKRLWFQDKAGFEIICLVIILVFCLGFGFAQERGMAEVKRTSKMKEVQGEVSGKTKYFISVIYYRDPTTGSEEEILLHIEKDTGVVHRRSLAEIAVGDIVRVAYEELSEEDSKGKKSTKRTAKTIYFVRPAVREPQQIGIDEDAAVSPE